MMALAHAGNVAAQTTLKSKLILPSHRILEQRSFHQKLPADVPVPPLPPPAPVSFPSHTAALIHRPSVAYASTKASSTPQAAAAPLRRDSVNSNHSADGATGQQGQHPQSVVAVHHLSTPGKQPLLLSARKSEPFASLTPGGPPPLTLSITPRPSMSSPPFSADSHQSPKTPHQHKQQLGLHFNSPGRDEPRTPRPDHFSLSARMGGDAFSADADINNPSTMKITPRPSLPKPLTLPYDEFQHDTAHHHDSGGHNNNSTTTPLLNASSNTSNGDRGGDATTPPSTTKLNGGGGASMSRRRQLLYRYMEDFMDRSLSGAYSSTSPTAASAGGHHYGHDAHHHYKSLESPLLVVDPSASNASLEEGGQQQQQHSIGGVDWNSASPVSHDRQEGGGGHYYERGGSFSSASSPHRHHQVELLHHGGLEVTSPVGLLPRRSATPSSAASCQRHMMLKTFSSSSFYQLRQSEKLQEQRQQSVSYRRPHSSSSSTIPHSQQQQQQQHAPPSHSCNAAMVGTKRWCLTPPPHATYGQSLRLQAISYVGGGVDEPSPYFQGGQQRQSQSQQRNNERSKQRTSSSTTTRTK
ncbi:Hypothetical protein, putative [Bodo saltans]|uniref:Uncharacterized protein n=1 Tax=Bodo saltans TaxID=75058 RepID=A0A0S4JIS3_BODSA|nr:Hypothetical protein, putative [Bodo saltans]|eukprot:CUG90444.1 Hypothetical protein, putative [Bodo saltans]